jgi:hypothetical protein
MAILPFKLALQVESKGNLALLPETKIVRSYDDRNGASRRKSFFQRLRPRETRDELVPVQIRTDSAQFEEIADCEYGRLVLAVIAQEEVESYLHGRGFRAIRHGG